MLGIGGADLTSVDVTDEYVIGILSSYLGSSYHGYQRHKI